MINVLTIPANFPLALAFTDTLSRHTYTLHQNVSAPADDLLQCCKGLSVCVESISKLLTRLNCPRPLKEPVLHQLAGALWTLVQVSPEGFTPSGLPGELLQRVNEELAREFESECSNFPFPKGKTKTQIFPPPGSIGDRGSGKFSTYFQALLELTLAGTEYQQKFHELELSSHPLAPVSPSPTPAGATAGKDPTKRTKRVRSRKGGRKEVEVAVKKKDEWVNLVRCAASLLRGLVLEDSEHIPQEVHELGSLPVCPNSRLLVVTSLDHKLDIAATEKTLRRICHTHGGFYKDRLYLPVEKTRKEEEGTEDGGLEGETAGETIRKEASEQEEKPSGDDQGQATPEDPSEVPTQEQEHEEETLQEPAGQSLSENPPMTNKPSSTVGPTPSPTHQLQGHAILELCCSRKVSIVSSALLSCPDLQCPGEEEGSINVFAVGDSLMCGDDRTANKVLAVYLRRKLFASEEKGADNIELTERAKRTFTSLFTSSLGAEESGSKGLTVSQVTGDLHLFLSGYSGGKESVQDFSTDVWKVFGSENEEGGGRRLDVEGFLRWVVGQLPGKEGAKEEEEVNVRALWRGLFACGYDLHFERLVTSSFLVP